MNRITCLFFCLVLGVGAKSQIDTSNFFIVQESVICTPGPLKYSPSTNANVRTVDCRHASYRNANGQSIIIKPNLISPGENFEKRLHVVHGQDPRKQSCFNVFYNGGIVYQGDSTINFIAILDRKEDDSTYLVSYIYRHICKNDFDKLKNGKAFYKDYLLNDNQSSAQTNSQIRNASSTVSSLSTCHGEKKDLIIASNMPFVVVKVGKSEGMFLMDFGTNASTIDTNGFKNGSIPKLVSGTSNKFDDFDFYGSWGTVSLNVQDHSNIQGLGAIRQAGILGTDFLMANAFTIDYQSGAVYRSDTNLCNDSILRAEGFKSTSTTGYYSNDFTKLKPGILNIPTVPVRIGTTQAVAQIDPGFDDRVHRHSVNINKAFFDALKSAGVQLQPFPTGNTKLSTCAGVSETVTAYKLTGTNRFEIIGTDGNAIISVSDAVIFLKDPPQEAIKCGGIGVWKTPAAQIGASFLNDSKQVIFDPYKSLVWFKGSMNRQQAAQQPQFPQQPQRGQQIGQQSATQRQSQTPQQVQMPIQTKSKQKKKQ